MSALARALGLPYLAQKIFGGGGSAVPANAYTDSALVAYTDSTGTTYTSS